MKKHIALLPTYKSGIFFIGVILIKGEQKDITNYFNSHRNSLTEIQLWESCIPSLPGTACEILPHTPMTHIIMITKIIKLFSQSFMILINSLLKQFHRN